MRIGYLECFSGISGDMLLGALVDAGVAFERLEEAAAALNVGARLEMHKVMRGGLAATKVDVLTQGSGVRGQGSEDAHSHEHDHPHHAHEHHEHEAPAHETQPARDDDEHVHAPHRSLSAILGIIGAGPLSAKVKEHASRAFHLLGEAEAAIHSIPIEKVHFHEVGAVDTIVDIVCAAAGCEALGPALGVDRWMASPLNVGSGTVKCQHGTLPVLAAASVAGACRAALGVGGDYYDVIPLEDGRIGLAVGDVSGKGIAAALLMASLRASLRGMTLDNPRDFAKLMHKVNMLVYEASASNRYATFFFAAYDPATRKLDCVNAGHNPPVVLRDGKVIRLEAYGPVVGLLPFAPYTEQSVVLMPGDLLLMFTDGISEAMTDEDEEWGEERMIAAARKVRDRSAQEVLNALFADADAFTAGAPQHDDMTMLILKLDGQPAAIAAGSDPDEPETEMAVP